ncbi:MAG: hypothetical protein ACKVU2_14525 [Saprospiraceae bacterium]
MKKIRLCFGSSITLSTLKTQAIFFQLEKMRVTNPVESTAAEKFCRKKEAGNHTKWAFLRSWRAAAALRLHRQTRALFFC